MHRGTFSNVSSALSPQRKNRRPAKGAAARKAFWARPANPELDRSGDWLLKNLTTTRAKAASRASLTAKGITLPDPDYWIAAHALSENLPLITTDRDFRHMSEPHVHYALANLA